jgi:hypothetical protein
VGHNTHAASRQYRYCDVWGDVVPRLSPSNGTHLDDVPKQCVWWLRAPLQSPEATRTPTSHSHQVCGMVGYSLELFYDLLIDESLESYSVDSSRGSNHLNPECFMVNTSDNDIEITLKNSAIPRVGP